MIGRLVAGMARLLALAGGTLLLAIVCMVCLSVAGRAAIPLGLRPIPGDVEMVEMGVALAVMAMMPYAHLIGANARVDIFVPLMGARTAAVFDTVANFAVLVVALILCWTLWSGLSDRLTFADTTFILRIPLWIGYAGAVLGAFAFIIVALLRLRSPAVDRP